eukprot:gene7343-13075_t
MLLQVHFKDTKSDTTASPFRGKSSWEPESVRNPNIYKYLDNVHSDILNLYTQNYYNPLNISKEEQEAIRSLKQIDHISIKKADKGGKIVLWPKDMYLRGATKQLDDANFYKEHPVDHTIETSAEITTFLTHLLHNYRLADASATSLVCHHNDWSIVPWIYKAGGFYHIICRHGEWKGLSNQTQKVSSLSLVSVKSYLPSQIMEICKDEGEKVEETEKTSIPDKDAGGKTKKYKFRTARRWQSRKRKGFQKKRKEGLEEKGQQIDETVATIYKPVINRSAEKLKSSPFESLISTEGKVQTRSKSYRRSNAKGEPVVSKGFKIMDMELIAHCIKTAAICSICKRADSQLTLKEVPKNRRGMGEDLFLECSICHQNTELKTSKKIKVNKRKSIYESNIRSFYAAQKMGQRGLKKFCCVMNMPPPVTMKSFNNIKKIIHKKSKERAEEEMRNAANELLDLAIIEDPKDIRVMEDGAMTCNVPVTSHTREEFPVCPWKKEVL